MAIRNVQVPMYQARIPISGGGGVSHIDTSEPEGVNPIVAALERILERKRQKNKGRLAKIGDKWALISDTGDVIKYIPTPPESGVKILEELAKGTTAAGNIPEGTLEQPIIDAILGPLRQKAIERGGLEEYEEEPGKPAVPEVPGRKRSRLGIDWLAKDVPAVPGVPAVPPKMGVRKKVKGETRPPKPKEYPDAKWSEEHQMWTIVKNGRLMGVK